MKKYSGVYTLACKGLPNGDCRGGNGHHIQEIRPGAGFKTGEFVKE